MSLQSSPKLTNINQERSPTYTPPMNQQSLLRQSLTPSQSNEFKFQTIQPNYNLTSPSNPQFIDDEFEVKDIGHHHHHHSRHSRHTSHTSSKRKKKRSCCHRFWCCCCHSRTGALLCAIFTLILLIGIGLAVFFLFPRIPEVELVSIVQKDTNLPINQTNFNELFHINQNNLIADVIINFKVKNNNYIDLVVNQLNLKGDLIIGGTEASNFLNGQLKNSINLKSMKSNAFPLPVTFKLSGTTSENSNQILALKQQCNVGAILNINYHASLDLALVSWTGYKPTIDNTFGFRCPWTVS